MTLAGPLGPMLGAGREAEVYAWGDTAVLKLYRPGFGGHRAEATALTLLNGTGIAPTLLDVVERDGRTGLVLERVDGPDMLTLLNRRPWRLRGLAGTLATAQLAMHRVRASADLPDVRRRLDARIDDAGLPPHLASFAKQVLDRLPDGDRLCHGDYHPGNVLVAAGRTAIIDWPNPARGVPAADHARTLLLLRWAAPLPGASPFSRALIAAGRSMLARHYTRTYRRGATQLRDVDSWLLVHVAARLSEGIETERDMLTGFLTRAARRTATR